MHIKDHATAQGWFRKHAAAPSSVGSWKAFVARNKKVQEPQTMAQGGRIIGKPGGIVEPGIEYYGDNVITYTGQGRHKGKHHLRLGLDKKTYRGSKEKLEKILERRKTAGGSTIPANLETFKYEKGFLTKKQFKEFLKKNHITGDDPQSFAKNHKINTKPNPLLKNHNLYDTSQFTEELITTIQKKQVKTGQATKWARKQFPPKTKSELHGPRYKTIVEHGGIKKNSPFAGTLDTHLGHGMNIWADKITGDTLVYTPAEINLAMSKKGGLDHKIRKVSEKIEAIKKQTIPAAEKKALLEALDTTLVRMASQSQGFKKVKLSSGKTFGGDRLTIDMFDIYPGKTEVEIRDIQNKYLNKKIITQKMVDDNPKLKVTPPEEIQKIQDAYFFEKNRKEQLKAASKIGKKEQIKITREVGKDFKKKLLSQLEKLGCPKGGKASGGRVGFSTGTTCAIKGREVAARILKNGTATEGQKTILREMVGAGVGFLKGTAKFAGNILNPKHLFNLRTWVGPEAAALIAGFEGGVISYDVINNNTPIKQALGDNWMTRWAMPKTLDEYQIEEMREKGGFSNVSSERFAQAQEMVNELNRNYEEIEFLKIDPTKSAERARKQKEYDAKEAEYFSFVGEGKGMDPYEFEKDRGRMLEERGAGEFIPEEYRFKGSAADGMPGTWGTDSEGKMVKVNEYGYANVADETVLKALSPEGWFEQGSGALPLKKSSVNIYDLPPSEIAKMDPEAPFEQELDWASNMKKTLKDVHEIKTPGDYRFADYEKLTEQDKMDLTNYYRAMGKLKENQKVEDLFWEDTTLMTKEGLKNFPGLSILEDAAIAKKWAQLYNYPGMQGTQDPYAEGGIASLKKKW